MGEDVGSARTRRTVEKRSDKSLLRDANFERKRLGRELQKTLELLDAEKREVEKVQGKLARSRVRAAKRRAILRSCRKKLASAETRMGQSEERLAYAKEAERESSRLRRIEVEKMAWESDWAHKKRPLLKPPSDGRLEGGRA